MGATATSAGRPAETRLAGTLPDGDAPDDGDAPTVKLTSGDEPTLTGQPPSTSGAGGQTEPPEPSVPHSALIGFMSVPVHRRLPIRRSTLLMVVAFVAFGVWYHFYPPYIAPMGSTGSGTSFFPGVTSTTTTTTTTRPPQTTTTTVSTSTTVPRTTTTSTLAGTTTTTRPPSTTTTTTLGGAASTTTTTGASGVTGTTGPSRSGTTSST